MLLRFRCVCLLALLVVVPPLKTQTLAHPGWRGNGIAPQAWWKHASFVRFGPEATFAQASGMLDAMSQAGIDSMILPDLHPAAGTSLPFNERFGTEDDLDALLREASARRMHVLLTMPVARLSAGNDELRFWMTRGIAGIEVSDVAPGDLSVLRGVRSSMARFPGERILMARVPSAAAPARAADLRHDPITLHLADSSAVQASAQRGSRPWQAVEVSSLEATMPVASNVLPVFDAKLLAQPDAAARIRSLLSGRQRRSPRRS